jgi:5-methylcytosine-specific restriction endonuclease McrA
MDSEALYLFEVAPACRIDDCGRRIKNKREQLCDPHYKRLWRYGDPLGGGPMRPNAVAGQKVEVFPDGTRRCTLCAERLPVDSFHKDANATGGRRSHCAECHKAKAREWYAANRERQAGRVRASREADPERHRQWDMERYARDRAKRIELATEHTHKRRLRMLAGEYDRTVTRANLRKQYGDQCFYCECVMDFGRYKRGETPRHLASIEHVHPISKGGTHTWDNVVLACLDCNLRKNARTLDEWAA